MLATASERRAPSRRVWWCALVAPNLLPGGPWSMIRPSAEHARWETVTVAGVAGDVVKVTVLQRTDPFYYIQILKDVPVAIPADSRLKLTFKARSRTSSPLRAVVEKVGPPYSAVAEIRPDLTPEWRQFTVTGTSPAYAPRGLGVRFQMGHQEGEMELADVRLENLGPDPLVASARAAIAPDAIDRRINQIRKGTIALRVVDRAGKPVRGAKVHVQQTGHAFLFGCNIFALAPQDTGELQRLYQQRFRDLLNYATLPFYWGSFEGRQGAPDYARLEAMARWCRQNGIVTKGHPLVWHEVYPAWAPKEPDAAIPLLEARVRAIIQRYRGLVSYWDVLNEACNASDYANTGEGAWIKRDGAVKVVSTALRWAREAAKGSDAKLLYNDFNTGEAHVKLLEGLKAERSLPDAIGIQSHMHGGPWPLEQVWLTAERFAPFKLPIHFTETTVVSGARPTDPGRAWESTPEGEKEQADYVERLYSVLYSHPSLEAITWWDMSDLNAWQQAPAGLIRKDMSPKPAYDRLMALIRRKWWTDARGETGASGQFRVRAFEGSHTVTVTAPSGKSATMIVQLPVRPQSANVTVRLP